MCCQRVSEAPGDQPCTAGTSPGTTRDVLAGLGGNYSNESSSVLSRYRGRMMAFKCLLNNNNKYVAGRPGYECWVGLAVQEILHRWPALHIYKLQPSLLLPVLFIRSASRCHLQGICVRPDSTGNGQRWNKCAPGYGGGGAMASCSAATTRTVMTYFGELISYCYLCTLYEQVLNLAPIPT